MSFQVVHFQKFGKGGLGGIEIHNEREKIGISNTNPDIDWSRTNQNYDLHKQSSEQTYHQLVKQRIEKLHLPKAVRKDAVVMCGFVITSDKTFFENLNKEQQELFFKKSYEFFAQRYGKENIISAKVHLDETTPHMHLYTVPVTSDGRLSAKSIFNRKELINLHDEFNKQVGKEFGLQRGESIEQGKRRTHFQTAEFKEYTKALTEVTQQQQKASEKLSEVQKQVNGIETRLTPLQAEYEAKKAYVRECDKACSISDALPSYAEVKEKGILKKQEYVTVPKEKWIEKHVSANEKGYLESATREFEKVISEFKKSSSAEHISQLERKINGLEHELLTTQKENIALKSQMHSTDKIIDRVNRVLNNLPEDEANHFIKAWKIEKSLEQSHSHSRGMEMSL